jgi:cold shock protein
MAGTATAAPT